LILIDAALPDRGFKATDIWMIGMRLFQAIQIHLRSGCAATDCLGVREADERGGAVRATTQQLQPILAGKIVAILPLPIAGLSCQLLTTAGLFDWVGRPGHRRQACNERSTGESP